MTGAALGIGAVPARHDPTPSPTPSGPPVGQLHGGTSNPQLPTNVCNEADFSFAIDLSGSIGSSSSFTPEKNGVKSFADAFQAAGGDGLYAGSSFHDTTGSNFTPGFVAVTPFKTAVNGLAVPNGGTPTAAGIAAAAANTAGDRASGPNVLFVVTDGSPNRPPNSGSVSLVSTWVTAANAAIDAANSARGAGWIVEAIYVGTPDADLPFGSSGNQQWVQAVMAAIGGGTYTQLGNFNSLVNGLLISVGCPTLPPTEPPTAPPTEAPTLPPTEPPTLPPTEAPTSEPSQPGTAPTIPPTDPPTTPPTAPPTAAPSSTPFESFQGETATPDNTPPPTNSQDGGNGSQSPLFALLICIAFGSLGLLAVEVQRRSLRR